MEKSGKNSQWITSISAGIRTELPLNSVSNTYESSHWGDPGVGWRIILKWDS